MQGGSLSPEKPFPVHLHGSSSRSMSGPLSLQTGTAGWGRWASGRIQDSGRESTWQPVHYPRCKALGKFLYFSVSWFPHPPRRIGSHQGSLQVS